MTPNVTLIPPRTHSTIRAQLRPFQANQMNIASSPSMITPITAPTTMPVRTTASVTCGSS